jgi:hypothetical protein
VVADDSHSISMATLMTRGFIGNGSNDGKPAALHWLAALRESAAANQSTVRGPIFLGPREGRPRGWI